MFEALFGNGTAEKVLVYLRANGQGYGRLIARTFGISVGAVQQQLRRLEEGNVILGIHLGRTKIYGLNTHYPLFKELAALLDRALEILPSRDLKLCFKKRVRRKPHGIQ